MVEENEKQSPLRETDAIGVRVAVLDGLRNRIAFLEKELTEVAEYNVAKGRQIAELEDQLEKADIFSDKMHSQNCALQERIAELEAQAKVKDEAYAELADKLAAHEKEVEWRGKRIAELEEALEESRKKEFRIRYVKAKPLVIEDDSND
jgi:uncharacterized coiled-coil protein SlyX